METALSPSTAVPLARIADSVSNARSLEDLVRPLLEVLEAMTGMESTYLTSIDEAANLQTVLYARNTRELHIPEALSVPWGDTLCRRALDEGRSFTDDVAARWGDSEAAAALGIQSYMSVPVRTDDGRLYGTLCAASGHRTTLSDDALHALRLFSRLISQQVERERLLEDLRTANAALSASLLTDPVTGLPNRRALVQEFARRTARGRRVGETTLVAFIDLDDFKAINDRHGHEVGDQFLAAIGASLTRCLRQDDFTARLGGDEFIALASVAPNQLPQAIDAFRAHLLAGTSGRFTVGGLELDYPGPSIGVVAAPDGCRDPDAVLASADAAMYADKRTRRATKGESGPT